MVLNGQKKIISKAISRSFDVSAVACFGKKVSLEDFSTRLKGILAYHQGIKEMQEEDPFVTTKEDDTNKQRSDKG